MPALGDDMAHGLTASTKSCASGTGIKVHFVMLFVQVVLGLPKMSNMINNYNYSFCIRVLKLFGALHFLCLNICVADFIV